jgi:hypothetical protein
LHSMPASRVDWNQDDSLSLSLSLYTFLSHPALLSSTCQVSQLVLKYYTTTFLFWLRKQVLHGIYSRWSKATCLNNLTNVVGIELVQRNFN